MKKKVTIHIEPINGNPSQYMLYWDFKSPGQVVTPMQIQKLLSAKQFAQFLKGDNVFRIYRTEDAVKEIQKRFNKKDIWPKQT